MYYFSSQAMCKYLELTCPKLENEMVTHSSILAWKTHGQRSLAGYSSWGRKESDTTERLNNKKKTTIYQIMC